MTDENKRQREAEVNYLRVAIDTLNNHLRRCANLGIRARLMLSFSSEPRACEQLELVHCVYREEHVYEEDFLK